jgi:hypothetical protein
MKEKLEEQLYILRKNLAASSEIRETMRINDEIQQVKQRLRELGGFATQGANEAKECDGEEGCLMCGS